MLNAFMSCYVFFMSWTPCFLQRPRVSVCCSCTHVTCYLFVVFRTLCFWRRPRACVLPSLPLVRTLCVVGACTQALVPCLRALCYCFGACTQAGSLVFSLDPRFVAVCGGFFANLAKQWRKKLWGFSEVGETHFLILFFVFCVVFLFFLFISLLHARRGVGSI